MWRIVVVLCIALYVRAENDAISEQRVTIHHQKSSRDGSLPFESPTKSERQEEREKQIRANPSYEFFYKVNDPETHDIKGQHEIKEGDDVTGNYWLVEPNGKKRTVNYQANDDKGFNAQIHYTAPLINEESAEDFGISQDENVEDANIKNSNDNMKANEGETIQNMDANTNIGEVSMEKNNLDEQNQVDNQEDGAENINNIAEHNIDRTEHIQETTPRIKLQNEVCCLDDYNYQDQMSLRVTNRSRKVNRTSNNLVKSKREKSKRNKNQTRIPSRIKNEGYKNNENRNGRRAKQESVKVKENSNNNKRQQSRRNKNYNKNNHDDSSENVSQINTYQQQNSKVENEVNKEKNINNEQNLKISANAKFLENVDQSNVHNSEIYEHRIRIHHPKVTSSVPKQEQRKH